MLGQTQAIRLSVFCVPDQDGHHCERQEKQGAEMVLLASKCSSLGSPWAGQEGNVTPVLMGFRRKPGTSW